MATTAKATFGIEGWDEHPTYEGEDGRKLTRATVTKRYQGDLTATGTMEYVMAYAPDGTAAYVGLERVVGSLGGRSGSFVLEDIGAFRDGVADSTLRILPGSGTDDFTGISGTASVQAIQADTQTMTLEYAFDA